jgi:type I restriction enzyme S subunit
MKNKQYPKYKDSGVEWLGEIPEHWEFKRLRFLTKLNPSKKEISLAPEDEISFVPMESVGEYGGIKLDSTKALDDIDSGYTYFANDDVIIAKITPCFENVKGALAKNLKNGVAFGTTELHVLRCLKKYDPRYLFYISISYPFRKIGESEMYGAGGQKRIPEDYLKDLQAPLSPIDEQKQIANYLDKKTAQIDELIDKKKKLIEKLDEKRTALITHAVTKGLDDTVKLKPSGIDWLGDIPEHWRVKRFKFIVSEPFKYGANEAAELEEPSFPRYIRITDVDIAGNLRPETFKSLEPEIAENYLLEEGDILLARSGATVGKSFYYKASWGKAAYAGYLIRARLNNIINSRFYYYFLNSNSYWEWLNSIFIQATIQNVSAEKYANLWLPVLPDEEKESILKYLDEETSQIDKLKDKIQKAIEKLEEYRSSLITNAVTGKIDVRLHNG